jgi:hypothetical protein
LCTRRDNPFGDRPGGPTFPSVGIRREVEGIVAVVGGRSKPRARQLPLATTLSTIDVEAALMDEGDRLAKSSRDGGEKTFIIPK